MAKKPAPPYPVSRRQYKFLKTFIDAGMDDRMMKVMIDHPEIVKRFVELIKDDRQISD